MLPAVQSLAALRSGHGAGAAAGGLLATVPRCRPAAVSTLPPCSAGRCELPAVSGGPPAGLSQQYSTAALVGPPRSRVQAAVASCRGPRRCDGLPAVQSLAAGGGGVGATVRGPLATVSPLVPARGPLLVATSPNIGSKIQQQFGHLTRPANFKILDRWPGRRELAPRLRSQTATESHCCIVCTVLFLLCTPAKPTIGIEIERHRTTEPAAWAIACPHELLVVQATNTGLKSRKAVTERSQRTESG